MNTSTNSWAQRLALALRHFFERASVGASDGLEAHLSTATSLHELENMQRQWDRARRGQRFYGAL